MSCKNENAPAAHIIAVPYPSQGHVNPMLQFCKRLVSKGAKSTFLVTNFIQTTMAPKPTCGVAIDTFSDGFDAGGFAHADGVADYLAQMEVAGSKTLDDLIKRHNENGTRIDCIVYDAFLPWVLDVTKRYGIKAATFFTQSCAVNYVYYYVHHGVLKLPVKTPPPVELPGLPPLEAADMPSFICVEGSYPAYFEMVLSQFSNVDQADFVLVNTFYKLEEKAVDSMTKVCPLLTIGPTLPSSYLDKRIENDTKYDINLFKSDPSSPIFEWLRSKPPASVVYVAFGSMDKLPKEQMEEIAFGLENTPYDFLWVVRDSDREEKVPNDFVRSSRAKGCLFVHWSPQLEVLAKEAIGCFFSHGGWNSTTEALSMGVPMVLMPQWTDQTTDAKLVQDMWCTGVRVKPDANGIVRREEVEGCIRKVMEGEKAKEMRMNARKWKTLAKEAVIEGGTSDINVNTFIHNLTNI